MRPADRRVRPAAGRRRGLRALSAPALLLFDIDGTLLQRASAAHREAIHAALVSVYGIGDPAAVRVDAAGRTDIEIARLILVGAGLPARRIDEGLDDLRAAAVEEFAHRCPADLSDRVVPGIPELLAELAERPDVRLSLLTGNLEPIARLKLRRAGIGRFFPGGQGAFGSDSEDRPALPEIARRRAGAPGPPHPPQRTWIIGDTPRDIACARADGVGCLAVTTGPHGPHELSEADGVAGGAKELRALLEGVLR